MRKQVQRFTREEILRGIEELGKKEAWFHCIDLGDGIATMQEPLPHLQSMWDRIESVLPDDISGKSVLDIGCNAGFFSVQAKRKGASHVLGIDMGERILKTSGICAGCPQSRYRIQKDGCFRATAARQELWT